MQNFKDLFGSKEVWFEIKSDERKKFLKWVKDLGCIWIDGEKIEPNKKVDFYHYSIDGEGRLGVIPIFAWIKSHKTHSVDRYIFSNFIEKHK